MRFLLLVAAAAIFSARFGFAQEPSAPSPKPPVDALIPWLLQEDAHLRGLPFAQVIFDATGKKVLAVDLKNETDRWVVQQISAVLDEVVRRLNAPESVIQGIARINEVSSHFEDVMRELLNAAPGLRCGFSANR